MGRPGLDNWWRETIETRSDLYNTLAYLSGHLKSIAACAWPGAWHGRGHHTVSPSREQLMLAAAHAQRGPPYGRSPLECIVIHMLRRVGQAVNTAYAYDVNYCA